MPFELDRYSRTRPMLYHLTTKENIARIRDSRRLESTALLMEAADEHSNSRGRRTDKVPITVGPYRVLIRDQAPLYTGHIEFEDGWDLEKLVDDLNRRVFFWPGWEHKPIPSGENYIKRYRSERPAILRLRFDSLCSHNQEREPSFCKFNSGSPRSYLGRRSLRGRTTFLPAHEFPYAPSDVVEVTFRNWVTLPPDTDVSDDSEDGWIALFTEQQE